MPLGLADPVPSAPVGRRAGQGPAEIRAGEDLSTLAWVEGELRRSLDQCVKALRRWLKESSQHGASDVDAVDPALLRSARAPLHQAVGALELVGQPVAAEVLRAAEAALQRLGARPRGDMADAVQTIERAAFAVLDYVARRVAGKPVGALAMFPQYAAAQALAGVERVHPSELWSRDWHWQALEPDPGAVAREPDDSARAEMEALVLVLMRQPGPEACVRMGALCAGLAAGGEGRARTLWQLAAALYEGQAAGLIEPDVHVKRIASRLHALARAAGRGRPEWPDRLARELLFFCLRARLRGDASATPRLAAVQSTWPPDDELAAGYDQPRLGLFDPARIAQARRRVTAAKEAWSAAAGGETVPGTGVAESMTLLADSVQRLFPDGDGLGSALQEAAALCVPGEALPAALAMEVATGMLYLEAVLDDGELDAPELPDRVRRLAARVRSVARGAEPHALESWMEELFRRVSDRQTMGSVVQELRASMAEVEKQVDLFFRDPAQTAVLIPVPAALASMRGVLSVLGIDHAAQAVVRLREEVDRLVRNGAGDVADVDAVFQRLADNLGALGFLVDMLGVQPHAAKALFRFDEASGRLKSVVDRAAAVVTAGDMPATARATRDAAPSDAATRVAAAEAAAATATAAARAEVRGQMGPTPHTAAGGPSVDSTASTDEDAEVRQVFLEEAREVIESARVALAALAEAPDDVSELTTVRRAFHTLKGSSRMVGLTDFGDTAWACERLYNARLAGVPRMDGALAQFSDDALRRLAEWVDAIAAGGPRPEASLGVAPAADALRDGRAADSPAAGPVGDGVVTEPAASSRNVAAEAIENAVAPDAGGRPQSCAPVEADAAPVEPSTLASMVPDLPSAADLDLTVSTSRPEQPAVTAGGVQRLDVECLGIELDLGALDAEQAQAEPGLAPGLAPADIAAAPAVDLAEPSGGRCDEAVLVLRLDGEPSIDAETQPMPIELAPSLMRADDVPPAELVTERFEPVADERHAVEAGILGSADEEVRDFAVTQAGFPEDGTTPTRSLANEVEVAEIPLTDWPEFGIVGIGPTDVEECRADGETEIEAGAGARAGTSTGEVVAEGAPEAPPDEAGRWADQPAQAPAGAAADRGSETDEQVKLVGPLRIPIPLFNIFVAEADEQSRRLGTELAEWALEPARPVGEVAIAMAHSLAGNSATVGHGELSSLARQLEHALMRSRAVGRARGDEAALFVQTADEIRGLLHQFAAGFHKAASAELVRRLQEHERWPMPVDAAVDSFAADDAALDEDHARTMAEPRDAVGVVADSPAAAPPQDAVDEEAIDGVDSIDAELFPIFEEEAEELLPQLHARLADWLRQPADRGAPAAALRTLHTFKGGARLAGAMHLGEQAHRLESGIERLAGTGDAAPTAIAQLLGRADAMATDFERLRAASVPARGGGFDVDAGAGQDGVRVPEGEYTEASCMSPGDGTASPDSATVKTAGRQPETIAQAARVQAGASSLAFIDWTRFNDAGEAAPAAGPASEPDGSTAGAGAAAATVRVRAALLDRLVGEAGEVSITRARLEADVRALQASMLDLTDNLERLRSQLRDLELQAETQMASRLEAAKAAAEAFDPLELDRFTRFQEITRMMAESVADVATVQRSLQRTLQSSEDDLAAQARLTRALQDDLLRTRMVEFESLADRLYRVVRLAAGESGKSVRMDLIGGGIEIDRGVLERMVGPFEHLLRNAVAHGIEPADARRAAGKPDTGRITMTVVQEGNEVAVEVRDDGAGLDLARIRARGVERGLLASDAADDDETLAAMIFEPGFSTAESVSGLAGRGVGMDVVRAEVQAVGGRILTHSEPGRGTAFRLLLPLTTAVTQVVMLRYGRSQVALPSTLVEVVRRATPAQIDAAYARGTWDEDGQALPFFWLGALLQDDARAQSGLRSHMVVVVRSAAQRVAVHVDEVVGQQEVVVKKLGPQLARLPGLAGVTLLPSGQVATIYNPVALATVYGDDARRRMGLVAAVSSAAVADADTAPVPAAHAVEPATPTGGAESTPRSPLVMVVDDSLTVRRVMQRLLQREGYRVVLAKDGLDAIEKLAGERPAVLLSDIEMPRMDGFDLVRNVRADERLAALPVIMITSRIASKHRELAATLGVEHYLGKPFAEDELLALVARHAVSDVAG